MDQRHDAQDILRCRLCKTPITHFYCKPCNSDLCKFCVGDHLLDESKEHILVLMKHEWSISPNYPTCHKHLDKHCELYCKRCAVPFCVQCVSSKEHKNHDTVDILEHFAHTKEILLRDLQKLETSIYPCYQGILSSIRVQKDEIRKNLLEITKILNEERIYWYREIDEIYNNLQSKVDALDFNHLKALDRQEEEIIHTTNKIAQTILELKKVLNTNDVHLVLEYKSIIAEFRHMPRTLNLSVPIFSQKQINKENLYKQFGSLALKISTTHADRPFRNKPKIIEFTDIQEVNKLTCQNDEAIWTIGVESSINLFHIGSPAELVEKSPKLYYVQGELLKAVQTSSNLPPWDIVVNLSGDLLYTDHEERTINIVERTQIHSLIQLQGWRPHTIRTSFTGDLLVIMGKDDGKETKIVRYSGSTEKQSIQWDDKNEPLFSSGNNACLSENRNLDICVSDYEAHAVVVVNAGGYFQFRYKKDSFRPIAISTDSQSKILIADCDNSCIHILDENDHFLRYIDHCGLHKLTWICLDSMVFVADSGKVKKIIYYK